MRLSSGTLAQLGAEIARPDYDRDAQKIGIVHFGIGAFHRAHQAWYTDLAMSAGDRNWAILGVSLRSATVGNQLNPQDGLYTVTERSGHGDSSRLVGAVKGVMIASQERTAVIAALAEPATRIVSLTVTEKGYCRAPDGSLDQQLAGNESFYAYLAAALRLRHDAGLPGLTVMSCDNLADNGRQLERLMGEYIARHDPQLVDWLAAECAFPCTMVDRIVPATTEADLAGLAARTGLEDRGGVMTEPFSQWVIENRFAGPRPRWEAVGAELVEDVRPYETAKLRLLNGAHSLLAYCGLRRGHEFVHQAIADPELKALVERLMGQEAGPTIAVAPGQDLDRYAHDLVVRFGNPALNHRLIQIAMDGSQKIPQRWLETLAWHQGRGSQCSAILNGIGAWLLHLRGDLHPVEDPLANQLAALWHSAGRDGVVDAVFGPTGPLASGWKPSASDKAAILAAIA